jgi:hypothetical protein
MARVHRPQHDDPRRRANGEGPQQDRMDDAEHRRAGTDADREDERGRDGEPPIASQPSGRVTEILGEPLQD